MRDGVVPVEEQLRGSVLAAAALSDDDRVARRGNRCWPMAAILPYAGVPNEVLAFIRLNEDDQVLVLHNLSAPSRPSTSVSAGSAVPGDHSLNEGGGGAARRRRDAAAL